MTNPSSQALEPPVLFLSGGGQMGERMRAHDWSATSLGPPAAWPQSLKAVLSACLNSPLLGTVLWGPDLLFLYNDAYIPSLADRHPASLGRPVREVWGDAWDQVAPAFHQALETGEGFSSAAVPIVMVRNGSEETTWWDFTAAPIRGDDGQIAGLLNQGIEITDRMRALDALRRSETAMRELNASLELRVAEVAAERDQIWRLSRDPFVICDSMGHWLSASPVWTEILGWRLDELIGRTSQWMEHPDDQIRTRDKVAEVAHGEITLAFTNRFRCRDGTYRSFSWTAISEGERLFCVARDVTAEIERAAALSEAQEGLRQSQKMEAVGQLTGGVAHDFNNVLAVIRTSIDLLRRPQLSDDRRQRFMQAISDAVARATRLTAQLLAFARRQALQPVVFDAGRNARAVSEMIGSLTGARVEVTLKLAATVCFVDADPSQFDTALVNLAVNARDAMPSGGTLTIEVAISHGIPAMPLQPAVAGEFVAVSISDTGTGITPEHLSRVFEPFFTTKGVGHGTGLGLSQVFGFAKQSGGDIRVLSTPGEGSTFMLYLPQATRPEQPVEHTPGDQVLNLGDGGCILAVEDNADLAMAVENTLKELGYTAVLARSAEQALAILQAEPSRFVAVFTDVVMAGMNGIELGREINRRHPLVPVVLTSGYSPVLAQTTDHEFTLLPKPYSLEDLSRVLHDATASGLKGRAAQRR